MAKLSYEQFRTEVMENIKYYLTEDYKNYKMRVQTITKASEEYEGLLIEPEKNTGISCIPTLNLTRAYEQYKRGAPLDRVVEDLADIRMKYNNHAYTLRSKEDLFNYEKVKNIIMPRLVRKEGNDKYLSDKPYTEVADLAVTYAIRLFSKDGFGDAVITNSLMELFKVSLAELHKVAMSNLSKTEPLLINIENSLSRNRKNLKIEEVHITDYNAPFFILSNMQKTLGAVMALNTDVMNRISKRFGKVYIIPCSIDEVIVVPKSEVKYVDNLKAMVVYANKAEGVDEAEVLSDSVYEYDTDLNSITIVR